MTTITLPLKTTENLIKLSGELLDLITAVPAHLIHRVDYQDLVRDRSVAIEHAEKSFKLAVYRDEQTRVLNAWRTELFRLICSNGLLAAICKLHGATLAHDGSLLVTVKDGAYNRTVATVTATTEYTTYSAGTWHGTNTRGHFAEMQIGQDRKARRYVKNEKTGTFNWKKIVEAISDELSARTEAAKAKAAEQAKKASQLERCQQELGHVVDVTEEQGGYYSDCPRARTWRPTTTLKFKGENGITGDLRGGPNKDGKYFLTIMTGELTGDQAQAVLSLLCAKPVTKGV